MARKDEIEVRTKICDLWKNTCAKLRNCDSCPLFFNGNDEDNWCSLRTLISKYEKDFNKEDFE